MIRSETDIKLKAMRINVKVDLNKYVYPYYKPYIFLQETQWANFKKKPSVLTCKLDNFQFPSANSMYNRFGEAFYNILTVIDSET